MKFGLQIGYWGAEPPVGQRSWSPPPRNAVSIPCSLREAFDATPLAWLGSDTERIRLGTSVLQLSARTPTACAMAALTL